MSGTAFVCPVVLATAGHVDHGKSALIEAMTGVNPDRLEVERKRGMTTELGFGELALPSGRLVGLVDVPGHAHYLRAMIQGATGADIALIAISAVEGVMPQTREHVRILELLGVRHAVVALTMCDLADDEMMELSRLDVEEFLESTAFLQARIVPVSARTGQGLDELRRALDKCVDAALADRAECADPHAAGPRLPVDRCFTITGAGTVVTGTLRDGSVHVGDELVRATTGARVRIRGIRVHDEVASAEPGQRVALNIVGAAADVPRGEVLGAPEACSLTRRIVVRFTYAGKMSGSTPRLTSGAHVRVMAGTAEAMGRLMLFEGDGPVLPGETVAVQLRLQTPLPVRAGDGVIVLSESPIALLGGGTVLLAQCRRSRALHAGERAVIDALSSNDLLSAASAWLRMRTLPASVADLASALDLSAAAAQGLLDELVQKNQTVLLPLRHADWTGYFAPEALDAAMGRLSETLRELHAAAPDRCGFTPGEVVRAAWPNADAEAGEALLACACGRGVCAVDGAEVFDPHAAAATRRVVDDACNRLLAQLGRSDIEPVSLSAVVETCGIERGIAARATRELLLKGALVKIGRDAVISAAAEQRVRQLVSDAIAAAGGAATTSVLKEALGLPRKQAIALLEHLDRAGFTVLDKAAGGLRSLR